MAVGGIYGNPGNGKGVLSMDIMDTWGNKLGLPVYGNLESIAEKGKLKNYTFIKCDEFMHLDARPKLEKMGITDRNKHALVYINEPYSWGVDSRNSTSEISKQMAKKALQHRKTRLDILYDTQIPSSIDKRFRFLCKMTWLAIEPIEDNKGNPVLFRYAYWGRYKEMMLGINKERAQKLYQMYDTEEQVEAEFTDEYLAELEGQDDIGEVRPRNVKPSTEFLTTEDGVRVYNKRQVVA